MRTAAKILFVAAGMVAVLASVSVSREKSRGPVFVVTPQAGWIDNEVQYSVPGNPARQTIKDRGAIYGVNLLYASPSFALGSLLHNSKTEKSTENGYLLYANYYLRDTETWQPAFGMNVDFIDVHTRLSSDEAAPLTGLDVNTSILVLFPTAGVSYKKGRFRLTPFVGFFNEQVDVTVNSPGMLVAGAVRNGFRSGSSSVKDYYSAGARLEFPLLHFIRLNLKAYVRFKENETPLYTSRNRLDVYLSRSLGISAKFDYFQDRNETLTFFTAGPNFVFY